MDASVAITIGVALFVMLVWMVGLGLVLRANWRVVPSGRALIITGSQQSPRVSFTSALVLPLVQRGELIDLSVKKIVIDRRGKEGLSCRDGIRADLEATFLIRVNPLAEDILKVAQSLGVERAGDQATLESLFTATFSEALKLVARRLDFEELYSLRDEFRDQVLQVIGADLNGFVIDHLAIDSLRQTPLEQLDPNDILDAQGIKKIRERSNPL
jgi:uncharacterized membrane protein YqiK